ncbi:MAG: hypothetical protein IMZ43_06510 [Thermoplasmata archaeon]|nr:hypothetical protein [Thermoplasmata archaeon]
MTDRSDAEPTEEEAFAYSQQKQYPVMSKEDFDAEKENQPRSKTAESYLIYQKSGGNYVLIPNISFPTREEAAQWASQHVKGQAIVLTPTEATDFSSRAVRSQRAANFANRTDKRLQRVQSVSKTVASGFTKREKGATQKRPYPAYKIQTRRDYGPAQMHGFQRSPSWGPPKRTQTQPMGYQQPQSGYHFLSNEEAKRGYGRKTRR